MSDVTPTGRWLPEVNPAVALPLATAVASVWFLAERAASVAPIVWLFPLTLVLLLYAHEELLTLWQAVVLLSLGRFVLLPLLLFVEVGQFPLFYGLFVAPVDALVLAFAGRAAASRVTRAST